MKITSNNIHLNNIKNIEISKKDVPTFNAAQKTSLLPNVYTNGVSQVNASTPVSYTKIGEIPIPGLDKNASMFKLSNGQRVIILPKKGPTFIRTSFNVGSMNEPDELRGISHFIEHSLFNGSKDLVPGEYDKRLTEMGGYTNAFTGFSETQYYLNLQLLDDKSLEEAIRLNALQTQFPTFPEYQIEREKEPVKSEIDMCSDNYAGFSNSKIIKNLFGIESTSSDLVIGTKDNINSLTREKVLDYYNTWYTPDNAVTVITGDVDVDKTMQLVSKYYNKRPDTSNIHKRQYAQPIPTNKPSRVDYKQKKDPGAFINIGFPIEAGTSNRDINRLGILLSYLASKNSNVSKVLDKYSLNLDFGIERISSDRNSPRVLSVGLYLPEEQVEEVLKVIYEGITDLINNPPSDEDIQDIINEKKNAAKNESEYAEAISDRLIIIDRNNDYNYYNNYPNDISSVTPQDISEMAKKYLDLNKAAICVMHPDATPEAQIIDNYETAKSKQISFGKSEKIKELNIEPKTVSFGKSISVIDSVAEEIPQIKSYKLQNNMQVLMCPANNAADATFALNLTNIQPNKENYRSELNVLEILLNRGSSFKDSAAFSKIKTKLNCNFGFSVSDKGIIISATFPSEKTNEVLPLMKEALLSPNFTQAEFDRAKKVVRDSLENESKSADDKLIKHLMPDSNYNAELKEQLTALDRMTLADCINLYYKNMYNSQASAAFTGAIDSQPYLQDNILNNLSQNFPMFTPYQVGLEYKNPGYKQNTQEVLLTNTEEKAQASIIQAYTYKLTGNIEDKAKIDLLDTILGSGGMSSRLFKDLRIDSNLAYRVRSSNSQIRDMGIMNLSITTSTDTSLTNEADPQNINKSLAGFKRNVERLKNEYVSSDELESAKKIIKTTVLNSQEGNMDRTSAMIANADSYYGQNSDVEYIKAIDKITVEDIMATANYVFKDAPITSILASEKTFKDLGINT